MQLAGKHHAQGVGWRKQSTAGIAELPVQTVDDLFQGGAVAGALGGATLLPRAPDTSRQFRHLPGQSPSRAISDGYEASVGIDLRVSRPNPIPNNSYRLSSAGEHLHDGSLRRSAANRQGSSRVRPSSAIASTVRASSRGDRSDKHLLSHDCRKRRCREDRPCSLPAKLPPLV